MRISDWSSDVCSSDLSCSQYSRSLLDRRVPDRWVFRAVLLPAIDPENCGGTNAFRAVVLQCPDFLGTERTSGLEARPIVPACLVPATERESRSRPDAAVPDRKSTRLNSSH